MRPVHYAILAALAVAGAVLLFLIRSGGDEPTSPKAATAEASERKDSNHEAPDHRQPPRLPINNDRSPEPGTDPATVTEVVAPDGTRIRDHRGTGAPIDLGPTTRPFKVKNIDPVVVAKMAQALRRAAEKCKAAHPGEVSAGARVQPRATYSIIGEKLTVMGVELSLTAIAEDGDFQRCFESAALDVIVDAPGHREVDSDTIAVPIKL